MSSHHVRACLITNPRSGRRGIDLSAVLPVLQANGWDVMVRQKVPGGSATGLAQQAARDGYGVVVDCGGDGTLNEIVEGLVGTDIAVGVLPGGTVNEWTRELGISPRLEVAARQLVGAVRRRVDVGQITVNGHHCRHFLLMAGLGFDGAVMARVSRTLKNRIGPLAVGLATLRELPFFDAVTVQIEMDEAAWQGKTSQIIVSNTRRYGGFTRFTPNASIDDGLLDVCVLTTEGAPALARQASSLVFRQQPSLATAEVFRSGQVTIDASAPIPLQLDGGAVDEGVEPTAAGMTYAFSVVAQGLTVLVPAAYDGTLFQQGARIPTTPSAAQVPERSHRAKKDRKTKGQKGKKRAMRVVAVGTDTITVARVRDGRVVTVITGPETVVRDVVGRKVAVASLLSTLQIGQVLQVRGPKVAGRDRIEACWITLRSPNSKR